MAGKFGTVIQRVLENVFKDQTASGSIHERQAAQAILDEIEEKRTEDLGINRQVKLFTPNAGDTDFSLDDAAPISERVARPLELYFLNSSGRWCPEPPGIPSMPTSQLQYLLSYHDSNYTWVEGWAVEQRTLEISPGLDGSTQLALVYLHEPKRIELEYDGSDWSYKVEGSTDESPFAIEEDSQAPFFSRGQAALSYGATARLVQGIQQGTPEQVAYWRDLSDKAWDRLRIERDRVEGDVPIQGYL